MRFTSGLAFASDFLSAKGGNMMAVLLCDWQGDHDDDLPTLRPQICLLPPPLFS